ncbi:phosphate propanoyltransferase [Atopobium minutum]|uniref:phosphate propanoyltransferase n=1 Tax=Atopobium minutum TaxID=1381 RepID=UPI0025F8E08A|nr:phosphate propanoyltransferase [Atopobium minutum]
MRKLICAQDVLAAAQRHESLVVDSNTIVTPQAADVAKECGVALVAACQAGCAGHDDTQTVSGDTNHEAAISPAEIERIITAAFDRGIWNEETLHQLLDKKPQADLNSVTVGVSGRHIHLSREHLDRLFGKGYELNAIKELSQPGQYAAKECVTLVGPQGVIQPVRVLGPTRKQTQVEVLAGDTFKLGIPQVVRLSGHLKGTPGITIVGPQGTVVLSEGVIVAARHIHMSPAEAAERGLSDGQIVSIRFGGERAGQLDNVVIRATENSALDCHIDTEEANALHIANGSVVQIIK